jgi:hypothetical protein
MQGGDLEEWENPRIVIVIEGVLCRATPVTSESSKWRLNRSRIVRYHYGWYDIPLKRMVVNKGRYPEIAHDVVTFLGDVFLDGALEFMNETQIPFDAAYALDYHYFCQRLRFQTDVRAVYDSDPARLDGYGQIGKAVVAGEDW